MDSIALLAKRCIEIKTARQLAPAVADRLQSLSKQLEESLYSPSLSEKLEKNVAALLVQSAGALDPDIAVGLCEEVVRSLASREDYEFESTSQSNSRRTIEKALSALGVLLGRLQIPLKPDELDGQERRMLLRYCSDYPVNIGWYQEHAATQERKATSQRRLIIRVGIFLLLATLAAPAVAGWRMSSAVSIQLVVSLVGLLVGGALTALKLLATGFDASVRQGIFWNAGADLKEGLYLFEEKWAGKAVSNGKLTSDFLVAIQLELDRARAIGNTEKRAFFATYKSPSDLLTAVSGGMDAAKQARQDLLSGVTDAAKARDAVEANRIKDFDQARTALVNALTDLKLKETMLKEVEDAKLAQSIDKATKDVIDAKAAVAAAQAKIELLQSVHP